MIYGKINENTFNYSEIFCMKKNSKINVLL